ncbi:uncharacterized protein [Procambarus clarkii]|uniref:uncharacterized protein isoform X2 n=1 Tax=Procambarus clarkii TaxID=6728 RepID=UPI0037431E7D
MPKNRGMHEMAGEVNNQEEVTNSIKENDDLQLSLESVLEAADRDQNVQLDIVSDFVRNPIQLLQDTYSEDVDNVMLHPLDLQAIYDGRNNFPNHLNDIINQYQRNFLDFLPWSAIVLIPEPTEAEMNAAEGMSEVIPEPAEEEMNVQVVGEVNLTDETQENERNKPIQRIVTPIPSKKHKFQKKTVTQTALISKKMKNHLCPQCGKKFIRLGRMKTRMLGHSGDRPHECPQCGKKFIRLGRMKTHMLGHSGDQSHKCPECEMNWTNLHGEV